MQGPIVKLQFIQYMKGKELEQFLKESSDELLLRLKTGLAPYDGVALGLQWKDVYWKVEEFINLFEDLEPDDEDNIAESLVGDFFTCPESLCKSLIRIKQLMALIRQYECYSLPHSSATLKSRLYLIFIAIANPEGFTSLRCCT